MSKKLKIIKCSVKHGKKNEGNQQKVAAKTKIKEIKNDTVWYTENELVPKKGKRRLFSLQKITKDSYFYFNGLHFLSLKHLFDNTKDTFKTDGFKLIFIETDLKLI